MKQVVSDFLSGVGIIKIRKNSDDLYNFSKLLIYMKELFGDDTNYFLAREKIIDFDDIEYNSDILEVQKSGLRQEKIEKMSKEELLKVLDNNFTDETFWHYIDINEGRKNIIGIEYNLYKGFSFGDILDYSQNDYTWYSVEELIKGFGLGKEFLIEWEKTNFKEIIRNLEFSKDDKIKVDIEKIFEDSILLLDDFCEWYEWQIVKFNDDKFGIVDLQFEGNYIKDNETYTRLEIIKRVVGRGLYFMEDEQEFDNEEERENTIEKWKNIEVFWKNF